MPESGLAALRVAKGTVCAGTGLRRLEERLQLIAGEETRSREARENAEVAARHLVPLRAALPP
jgi:hypothetical protein